MSGIAASSLIVLAPVAPAAKAQLEEALKAIGALRESPFAQVPGTHFARLVSIAALPGRDYKPLDAEGPFLMLCADFDSKVESWAAAACAQPTLLRALASWEGFPSPTGEDPQAIAAFLQRHNSPAGFSVPGYRSVTVGEVTAALTLRRALRALAVRAQREHLSQAALRDAWHELIVQ